LLVSSGAFQPDPEQCRAAGALDAVWHCVTAQQPRRLWARDRDSCRGLYLWGSVGRGKTWLMDLFFDSLPFEDKRRVHFHRFMEQVHNGLKSFADRRDPLRKVGRQWAEDCRVLCLDEFFVSDIADAMLLSGLLDALFSRGVTLVTTSNVHPDALYRDGLQRAKFLPAIERIKAHTQVLELGGDVDFRLRILEQSDIYHHPLDDEATHAMSSAFERMAAGCELEPTLRIHGRDFSAVRRGDGIVWFDFAELCLEPRSGMDYIEIARRFNTVIIGGIRRMTDAQADAGRRFVTMIDEFYDRNVKVLISAEAPPAGLYTGKRLAFEFQRTASRLTEMQSHEYLARPHLP
jgi:cell division protein ZapE